MPTLRAVVRGGVQGVGFRHFVCVEARRLDLTGTVENRADGGVEVWAEGSRTSLHALVEQLHRGPMRSRVDEVRVEWLEESRGVRGFRIIG